MLTGFLWSRQIPGTGEAESHLAADEVEIGMGIHNEAGIEKIKLPKSKELIKKMLGYVTNMDDSDRAYLPFKHDGKDEVVLLVNNLGGMSSLEESSIANDAVEELESQKISVKRIMVGSVMVRPPERLPTEELGAPLELIRISLLCFRHR